MAGWNNWAMTWMDAAIYPVLAAYYLGFFFRRWREGATIGGIEVSAGLLQWLIAAVIIWAISALQIRGRAYPGCSPTGWGSS